jgi:hypothetical protein
MWAFDWYKCTTSLQRGRYLANHSFCFTNECGNGFEKLRLWEKDITQNILGKGNKSLYMKSVLGLFIEPCIRVGGLVRSVVPQTLSEELCRM